MSISGRSMTCTLYAATAALAPSSLFACDNHGPTSIPHCVPARPQVATPRCKHSWRCSATATRSTHQAPQRSQHCPSSLTPPPPAAGAAVPSRAPDLAVPPPGSHTARCPHHPTDPAPVN
eukprot:351955-Chlamydomonas_euryale.AAC.4